MRPRAVFLRVGIGRVVGAVRLYREVRAADVVRRSRRAPVDAPNSPARERGDVLDDPYLARIDRRQ